MSQKKSHITNTVIPQSNYRKKTSKELNTLNTDIPSIGKKHNEERAIKEYIKNMIELVNQITFNKKESRSKLEENLFSKLFKETKIKIPTSFNDIWKLIELPIVNSIKVHYLTLYIEQLLLNYDKQINFLVAKYKRHLPHHISLTEGEDLLTIAQLEFIETFKAWKPIKNEDIWPLAYTRINGAMKDHIRYISKADPTRFYDWVVDAANLYLAVNNDNSHELNIENNTELERALKKLNQKEKTIIKLYINEDQTFKSISQKIGLSESQISRIYKEATKKIKNILT